MVNLWIHRWQGISCKDNMIPRYVLEMISKQNSLNSQKSAFEGWFPKIKLKWLFHMRFKFLSHIFCTRLMKTFCFEDYFHLEIGIGVLWELGRTLELQQRISKMQTKSEILSTIRTSTVLHGKGKSSTIRCIPLPVMKLSVIVISDIEILGGPRFCGWSSPFKRILIFDIPLQIMFILFVVEWQPILMPKGRKLEDRWIIFTLVDLVDICFSVHVPTGL